MEILIVIRLFTISARLIAFVGAAISIVASVAVFYLYFLGDFYKGSISDIGLMPLIIPAQILIAAWVLWNVLKRGSRPLLRVLLVAFVGSFAVAYGWYFLLTPRGFLVGVGNLLYLLAALSMFASRLVSVADERTRSRT